MAGKIAYDAALKGDKAGGTEDVKPLDSNTQVQLAIMATVSTAACQAVVHVAGVLTLTIHEHLVCIRNADRDYRQG